jgi:hypothetical protein
MKYDYKTGRFDLSDTKAEKTYDFSLKNTLTGGGWIINAIEGELRAFCSMNRLRIEVYKSGWIWKSLTFVIKGEGTKSYVNSLKDKLMTMLNSYT